MDGDDISKNWKERIMRGNERLFDLNNYHQFIRFCYVFKIKEEKYNSEIS